jgi:hypothetical protein
MRVSMAQAFDPIRLFHQLEQLQKAVFRCAVDGNPFVSNAPSLFAPKLARVHAEIVVSRFYVLLSTWRLLIR